MVLETVEIHANTGEKRKHVGFPGFSAFKEGPPCSVLPTQRRGTQAAPTGREKCGQKVWVSSWGSNQTNTSVLGCRVGTGELFLG